MSERAASSPRSSSPAAHSTRSAPSESIFKLSDIGSSFSEEFNARNQVTDTTQIDENEILEEAVKKDHVEEDLSDENPFHLWYQKFLEEKVFKQWRTRRPESAIRDSKPPPPPNTSIAASSGSSSITQGDSSDEELNPRNHQETNAGVREAEANIARIQRKMKGKATMKQIEDHVEDDLSDENSFQWWYESFMQDQVHSRNKKLEFLRGKSELPPPSTTITTSPGSSSVAQEDSSSELNPRNHQATNAWRREAEANLALIQKKKKGKEILQQIDENEILEEEEEEDCVVNVLPHQIDWKKWNKFYMKEEKYQARKKKLEEILQNKELEAKRKTDNKDEERKDDADKAARNEEKEPAEMVSTPKKKSRAQKISEKMRKTWEKVKKMIS